MKNSWSLTGYIDWAIRSYTIVTIAWCIVSYFNIMPYYQVRLYKTNSVMPRINLFPGERIRLELDSLDGTTDEIANVKWMILKGSRQIYVTDGLSPTIKLPTIEGGLYKLDVIANTSNGQTKKGNLIFYVVQDKAKQLQ